MLALGKESWIVQLRVGRVGFGVLENQIFLKIFYIREQRVYCLFPLKLEFSKMFSFGGLI